MKLPVLGIYINPELIGFPNSVHNIQVTKRVQGKRRYFNVIAIITSRIHCMIFKKLLETICLSQTLHHLAYILYYRFGMLLNRKKCLKLINAVIVHIGHRKNAYVNIHYTCSSPDTHFGPHFLHFLGNLVDADSGFESTAEMASRHGGREK